MHKQRALAAVEWKVNELLFSRPAPKVIVPRGGGRGEEGWGWGGGGKTTSFPLPNDSPKNSHPKIVNISQNVWSSSNGRLFDQMLYRKRRQQQKSYESWKVTSKISHLPLWICVNLSICFWSPHKLKLVETCNVLFQSVSDTNLTRACTTKPEHAHWLIPNCFQIKWFKGPNVTTMCRITLGLDLFPHAKTLTVPKGK